MEKLGCLFLVFLSGIVSGFNISWLRYGIPTHYHGEWWKVILSCFIALVFGYIAISKTKGV